MIRSKPSWGNIGSLVFFSAGIIIILVGSEILEREVCDGGVEEDYRKYVQDSNAVSPNVSYYRKGTFEV